MISKEEFLYKIKQNILRFLDENVEKERRRFLIFQSFLYAIAFVFALYLTITRIDIWSCVWFCVFYFLLRLHYVITILFCMLLMFMYDKESAGELFLGYLLILIFLTLLLRPKEKFIYRQKNAVVSYILSCFNENIINSQDVINNSLVEKSLLFFYPDIFLDNLHSTIKETVTKNGMHYPVAALKSDAFSGCFSQTRFSCLEAGVLKNNILFFHILFSGIFLHIELNRNLKGHTLVLNTTKKQSRPLMENIILEDASFMKEYQVLSDNQIEVRTLLTPAFMSRLEEVKRLWKCSRVDISFFDNHALFALYTSKNLFEPFVLHKKFTSMDRFAHFYDEMKCIYDIISV